MTMPRALFAPLALAIVCGCSKKEDPAPTEGKPSASSAPAASVAKPTKPAKPAPKVEKKPLGDVPVAGNERKVKKSTLTQVRTLYQGRDVVIGNETSERTSEKFLAVKDGAIQKIQVTYDSAKRVRTMSGNDQVAPSVIAGKTYIVERNGSKITVTNRSGSPVTADEQTEVAKDYSALGKKDPIIGAVPKRQLKEGEPVEEVEEALKRYFIDLGDDKNKITVNEVVAKLKGTTDSVHIFEMAVDMKMEAPRQAFMAKLAGEFHVRKADNWPTKIAVEGPVDVKLPGNAGLSQGKMKISLEISY